MHHVKLPRVNTSFEWSLADPDALALLERMTVGTRGIGNTAAEEEVGGSGRSAALGEPKGA